MSHLPLRNRARYFVKSLVVEKKNVSCTATGRKRPARYTVPCLAPAAEWDNNWPLGRGKKGGTLKEKKNKEGGRRTLQTRPQGERPAETRERHSLHCIRVQNRRRLECVKGKSLSALIVRKRQGWAFGVCGSTVEVKKKLLPGQYLTMWVTYLWAVPIRITSNWSNSRLTKRASIAFVCIKSKMLISFQTPISV